MKGKKLLMPLLSILLLTSAAAIVTMDDESADKTKQQQNKATQDDVQKQHEEEIKTLSKSKSSTDTASESQASKTNNKQSLNNNQGLTTDASEKTKQSDTDKKADTQPEKTTTVDNAASALDGSLDSTSTAKDQGKITHRVDAINKLIERVNNISNLPSDELPQIGDSLKYEIYSLRYDWQSEGNKNLMTKLQEAAKKYLDEKDLRQNINKESLKIIEKSNDTISDETFRYRSVDYQLADYSEEKAKLEAIVESVKSDYTTRSKAKDLLRRIELDRKRISDGLINNKNEKSITNSQEFEAFEKKTVANIIQKRQAELGRFLKYDDPDILNPQDFEDTLKKQYDYITDDELNKINNSIESFSNNLQDGSKLDLNDSAKQNYFIEMFKSLLRSIATILSGVSFSDISDVINTIQTEMFEPEPDDNDNDAVDGDVIAKGDNDQDSDTDEDNDDKDLDNSYYSSDSFSGSE